jgi:type II secretory pathway pseudopilin PulG
VSGTSKSGFALIDLLLALVVIGLVSAIALPNMKKLLPSYTRRQFLSRLEGITQAGWQRAIRTREVHKVLVEVVGRRISLYRATDQRDAQGKVQYQLVKDSYIAAPFSIPSSIDIKQFFIEGVDEMGRYMESPTGVTWFFIMPEGMTQEVIINMVDTNQEKNGKPVAISLVINPFTARFQVYDEFQKP